MASRCVKYIVVVVAFCSGSVLAQNTPPTVEAGNDSTIPLPGVDLINNYRMWGSVQDTNASLITAWTKISGPDTGFVILFPNAANSRTTITAKGIYEFRLTATDGPFTVSDSVTVTVGDSLPFLVVNPTAGARIALGDTCTVVWQYDQTGAGLRVFLSTNGGRTYVEIGDPRIRANQWLWQVADTLPVSDQCRIKVQKYTDANRNTVSGQFSLIPKAGNGVRRGVAGALPRSSSPRLCSGAYALDGRSLVPANPVGHGSADVGARGVVIGRPKPNGAGGTKAVLMQ